MLKVILCGYNWTGCKALRMLIEMGHEVYVYTHESPYYVSSLLDYCKELNISYSCEKIQINNIPFKPDIVCSIYYRYIIPEDVIEYARGKIFNLHPSLLPKYKGCSSLTWAMINNEKHVGFSYHYLTADVDSGNILLQKQMEIEPFELQSTLYERVMFESMKYFNDVINMVADGIVGTPQDKKNSLYYKRGCPCDGEINDKWNIKKIKRFIRSMIYPPLPTASYKGVAVKTFDEFMSIKGRTREEFLFLDDTHAR